MWPNPDYMKSTMFNKLLIRAFLLRWPKKLKAEKTQAVKKLEQFFGQNSMHQRIFLSKSETKNSIRRMILGKM